MSSKTIKVSQVESNDSEVEVAPKIKKSSKSLKDNVESKLSKDDVESKLSKVKSKPSKVESEEEYNDEVDEEVEEEVSKKPKETFDDLMIQYEKYKTKISKSYVVLSSQLVEIKKFEKNIDSIIVKMSKLYSKNSKSKTKKTNVNSGFNKEVPVPQVLIDFLELEETILPRPKVGSLLTQKFKELGLKTGQFIKLDEDTIEQLGLDESYLEPIKQTHFQTMLATFYKKN
jgi:hypothetical protein